MAATVLNKADKPLLKRPEAITAGLLAAGAALGRALAPQANYADRDILGWIIWPLAAGAASCLLPGRWYRLPLIAIAACCLWEMRSGVVVISLGLGLGLILLARRVDRRAVCLLLLTAALALGGIAWQTKHLQSRVPAQRTAWFLIGIAPLTGSGAASFSWQIARNIQVVHERGYLDSASELDVPALTLFWLYFGLPGLLAVCGMGLLALNGRADPVPASIAVGLLLAGLYLPWLQWTVYPYAFWMAAAGLVKDGKCLAG